MSGSVADFVVSASQLSVLSASLWDATASASLAAALASALLVTPASRLVLTPSAPSVASSLLSASIFISGFGGDTDGAQAALDALNLLFYNASVSPLPAAVAATCPLVSSAAGSLALLAPPSLAARVAIVVNVPASANLTSTAAALTAVASEPASLLPGLASCAAAANISASSGAASQPTVVRFYYPTNSLLQQVEGGAGGLTAAAAAALAIAGIAACCVAACCVAIRRRRRRRVTAFMASRVARASEAERRAAQAGECLTRAEQLLALGTHSGRVAALEASKEAMCIASPRGKGAGEDAAAAGGGGGGDMWPVAKPSPDIQQQHPARARLFFGGELAGLERAVAWGEARAAAAQEALIEAAGRLVDGALRRGGSAAAAVAPAGDGAKAHAGDSCAGDGLTAQPHPPRRVSASSSEAARAFAGGGVNPLWAAADALPPGCRVPGAEAAALDADSDTEENGVGTAMAANRRQPPPHRRNAVPISADDAAQLAAHAHAPLHEAAALAAAAAARAPARPRASLPSGGVQIARLHTQSDAEAHHGGVPRPAALVVLDDSSCCDAVALAVEATPRAAAAARATPRASVSGGGGARALLLARAAAAAAAGAAAAATTAASHGQPSPQPSPGGAGRKPRSSMLRGAGAAADGASPRAASSRLSGAR